MARCYARRARAVEAGRGGIAAELIRNGNGLRVVHQVCDFVDVRCGSFGTNIRVYRDLT